MQASKRLDMAALSSIPVIMTLSNSMLIPILPLMEKHLDISSVKTSLVITVYAVIAIICIPIAGFLSDRWGRKAIIVPSLLIAAIGGVIAALAAWLMEGSSAYWLILLGRFIQGIGAAGAFPIVLPLVGDMFSSDEEVSSGLGLIETANTFGKVVSPIIGAALALVVWYLPFIVIPFICLASSLAVIFAVKVPKKRKANIQLKPFIRGVRRILRLDGKWLYTIFFAGGMSMFVLFGFLFFLSDTLEKTHDVTGIGKGALLAIPLSGLCLASYFTGKWTGKNKRVLKWVTATGFLVVTALMIVCACLNMESKWLLLSMMMAAGIGIGISLPCMDTLITEGIDKKQRGTITSLYSSMRFIGVAIGPPITSLVMGHPAWLFIIYACAAFLASAAAIWFIRPKA